MADIESAKTKLIIEAGNLKLVTETHMGTVRDIISLGRMADAIPIVEAMVSAELILRMLKQATEMAVLPNCTMFRNEEKGLFRLVSNLG